MMKVNSCPENSDPPARPERGIYTAVPKRTDNTSEETSVKPEPIKKEEQASTLPVAGKVVPEPTDWTEYIRKRPKRVHITYGMLKAYEKFAALIVRGARVITGECLRPDSQQLNSGLELDLDALKNNS